MVYHAILWYGGPTHPRCATWRARFLAVPWYTMYTMVYHCVPWYTMVTHGIPWFTMQKTWYTMAYCGIPWYTMVYHGIPWYSMVYHGIAWYTIVNHGIPWYTIVYHGVPWYTMEHHELPKLPCQCPWQYAYSFTCEAFCDKEMDAWWPSSFFFSPPLGG